MSDDHAIDWPASDALKAFATWGSISRCIDRNRTGIKPNFRGPTSVFRDGLPVEVVKVYDDDLEWRDRKIIDLIAKGYEPEHVAERFGLRVHDLTLITGNHVSRGPRK